MARTLGPLRLSTGLTESAVVGLQEEIGFLPVGMCDIRPVKLRCRPYNVPKTRESARMGPGRPYMPLGLRPRLFHNVSDSLPTLPNFFDRCGAIDEIGVIKRGALGAR